MKQERHLARDDDGFYAIFEGNPEKDGDCWWSGSNGSRLSDGFTEIEFRTIFGCHPLRKGRKKRIKRILIELED